MRKDSARVRSPVGRTDAVSRRPTERLLQTEQADPRHLDPRRLSSKGFARLYFSEVTQVIALARPPLAPLGPPLPIAPLLLSVVRLLFLGPLLPIARLLLLGPLLPVAPLLLIALLLAPL